MAPGLPGHPPASVSFTADPRNQRTGDIIADLADELNGFLVGGLSSSRAVPAQIAGGVTEGGVSGVLLSETVAVATALSQELHADRA